MGQQTTPIPWKPYTTKSELYGTNIDFIPNSLIDGMTALIEVIAIHTPQLPLAVLIHGQTWYLDKELSQNLLFEKWWDHYFKTWLVIGREGIDFIQQNLMFFTKGIKPTRVIC